jgi:hypothetical protein
VTTGLTPTPSTPTRAPVCHVNELAALRGRVEPRLWTPPLRELTPYTSYGWQLVEFAESIGEPFDPWQEWLAVHIGELTPDGAPRFRTVLILVSRQNGKTRFLKVWALWNLFVDMVVPWYEKPTLLGISSKLDYAKETWDDACKTARRVPRLSNELPKKAIRTTNGEQVLSTVHDTRYKIAASNEDAGRSLTIMRLMVDELRRQKDWVAWDAAEPTTSAVVDAQIVAASNQGDDSAVVLDSLRSSAISFIEIGEGDDTLGLFEWSAPDGADPTDVDALLQANPNAGYRLPFGPLLNRGARAKAAGGKQLTGFKTESMCMRVPVLDPAIDAERWDAPASEGGCLDPGSLAGARDRIALLLDVSVDLCHATLTAAAVLLDGRVRLEVVAAWHGRGCTEDVKRDLLGHIRRVKPRAFGWFPDGPAAALQATLRDRSRKNGRTGTWPPAGVVVAELTAETPGICMAFGELVLAGGIAHSADPLQDQHVHAAQKFHTGTKGQWVFARLGSMPIDATYAGAGAAHLALTMPPSLGKPRLIAPADDETDSSLHSD